MNARLNRVILYVQDVDRLAKFYSELLGRPAQEEIPGEWAVLRAGACEVALHRVGEPYRDAAKSGGNTESNVKLVFMIDRDLEATRTELITKGVPMREIKSYPGQPGRLCDGRDPEGNVFQLWHIG